jgi:hypothetical protein
MVRSPALATAFAWVRAGLHLAPILIAATTLLGCVPTHIPISAVARAPLYAFCGAAGERCCRPPGSPSVPGVGAVVACDQNLGCDISTNTCVSPCGAVGQVCCDGPETRATKWTPDGKLYSPNFWNMKEMCDSGGCDPATHRCFSCGNADGVACCPPDAEQATARCVGERLSCAFTPGIFADSGVCHECGIRGREPCPWGCDDALGVRNGLCDVCGDVNQPRCDNGCKPGLGMLRGLCQACGNLNEVACDNGCFGGLATRNGICVKCGGSGQPPCDSGCKVGTRLINGVCQACGGLNQVPCTSGCNYPLHVAGGVCQQCGGLGQISCDVGCNSGLVIVNGRCQYPTPPPPLTCATSGQTCVADYVSGPHCCQSGAPLLCVYSQCRPCVPHGQECTSGGPQTCCNAVNGDTCRLDSDSGKATCGIPDGP